MYIDQKLKQYNEREERFRLAVAEATQNKSASINSIANKYRVSRTTLSRRIHGFKNTRNSHEKQQKFTNDEEMLIVSRIQQMLQSSDQIPPKKEVLNICEQVLKDKFKDRAPTEGENFFKVGKNWIDRFLERHNDKLMVNATTTLSEYYRSEFLQRKKLRSDRGYKTSNSSTPSSEHQAFGESDQAHTHHQPYSQYQPPSLDAPRQPAYPQPSESGFGYQTAVDQSQMGSYLPGYMAHNPSTSGYSQEWQFNNFQRQSMYPQTNTQPGSQQPGPPANFSFSNAPLQQHQMPPLVKSDSNKSQYNNPSYVYGAQNALKPASPLMANNYGGEPHHQGQGQGQPNAQQQQQLPQPGQPSYTSSSGTNFGSYTFTQQQPYNNQASTNDQGQQQHQSQPQHQGQRASQPQQQQAGSVVPSPQADTMQFYQGQRLQYGSVKQRILDELKRDHVDVGMVTKLVELTFGQIERDLGGDSGTGVSGGTSNTNGYGLATY